MNQDERLDEEMREEHDFSRGTRGNYASAYADGTIVVLLDSDLASVFRDSATVNQALREYLAEHGEPPRKVG